MTEKGEFQRRVTAVLVGARTGSGNPSRDTNGREVGCIFRVRISCEKWPNEVHTSCDKTRTIIVACFGLANEVRYLLHSWVVGR